MSEQKIIDLIKASQAVIKNELLPQSGSQKYNLLMLMRSLEILQAYILQKDTSTLHRSGILQDYFSFPIKDIDEATQLFISDIREGKQSDQTFETLKALNLEELKITEPKVANHG
ncbi:hypothetical protein U2E86_00065 [Acinetobacter baumannii]|uniref:hypothetical protein n=1 Tax=Acinetobacter baumannii TaxID=470 RepID=UPI00119FA71D|nr:hypothetical protein [Acinetobacter baumannii]MCF1332304.1 hypothetical protein [Acinetobacter baumannii]MCP9136209.1 hypothetical protein [Acinetobacter baumannii]MDC4652506.1 hypothetical protein [Acinetobacter baumannii]MDC4985267.1 hypothetical protein [Acinetobacter baumannii]MDC5274371.1 hypothetical protein [Acinetobacter baumannii]